MSLIYKYTSILNNLFKTIKIGKFDVSLLQVVNDIYELIKKLAILTEYELTEVNILLSNIYQYIAYFLYSNDLDKKLAYKLSCQSQELNIKLTEKELEQYRLFQSNLFDVVRNLYVVVTSPIKMELALSKNITVTITTCKRLDLFIPTMNSFFNCCKDLDLIKEIIVVDDNSSEEDRKVMRETFPFISYYMKNEKEKGHALSMNILQKKVTSKYQFHLEDDWKFIREGNYFQDCIQVLEINEKYGQCLLNRNYGEEHFCYDIIGGKMKFTNTNKRYYEHEYYPEKKDLDNFLQNNPKRKHCTYWPHYSLRVGLSKVNVLKSVGEYNEKADFFEREFAFRYVELGYITTFLDGIYCVHTGRKTWEIQDEKKINAYSLNKQDQFGKALQSNDIKEVNESIENLIQTNVKREPSVQSPISSKAIMTVQPSEIITKPSETIVQLSTNSIQPSINFTNLVQSIGNVNLITYVINLERRPDRWNKFMEVNKKELSFKHVKFNAIDGKKLTPNPRILKLFETGDYKYRRGMVGCALSHLQLWYTLVLLPAMPVENIFLILEDDITLTKNFYIKLQKVIKNLNEIKDWDVCFLGHFLYPQFKNPKEYDQETNPTIRQWFRDECIQKSMGGTIGYLINKKGAANLMEIIRKKGIFNGIDWIMFKSSYSSINEQNEENKLGLRIFYCSPHIVFSECFEGDNKVDSDIQFDHDKSLYVDVNKRLTNDVTFILNELKQDGVQLLNYQLTNSDLKIVSESKVLMSKFLPKKSMFLTKITIIDFSDYTIENMNNLLDKIETYPIKWYVIEDVKRYIFLMPDPLLTPAIESQFVLGGYLDYNTLLNIM